MKRRIILIIAILSATASSLHAQAAQSAQAPASAASYYNQGRAFMVEEDWYSASEALLECLRLSPAHVEATAALAECYYNLGEFDEALAWARKARVLARGNIALANLEAFTLIALGRLDAASQVIAESLSREPYNKEALFAASELDIARGHAGDAVRRYQEAVRRYPDDRRLLVSLALVQGSLGNTEQAKSYIERAMLQHPDDYRVYYYAAYLDAEAGRINSAITYAEKALFYKPGFDPARSLLANLRYRTGKYEEAARLADEAVAFNQKNLNAWYLKGMSYAQLGRKGDARNIFINALAIDQGDEFIRIALEERLIADTNLEDPARIRWADYHFNRARNYKAANLSDQALFEYRRGLRINPYAPARKEYAEILRLQGYPTRYVDELRFMRQLGVADKTVEDAVEAYDALLAEALYRQWGVDPVSSVGCHWNVAIFSVVSQSSFYHADAGALTASYIKDFMIHDRNIIPMNIELRQPSFSSAFREARSAGADYFLIISVNENERDIAVKGELFVARTGSPASVFSSYRTGADKLRNASRGITEQLSASLPFRGVLLQHKQGQGLIDKGKADGVISGSTYDVVKKERPVIKNEGIGILYSPEDVVGKLVITIVDEEVASGTLTRIGFFDRIADGDEVLLLPEVQDAASPPRTDQQPAADPELRALLRTLR
ncbi:MAG: tetratricopeptide repeat protein [Treponema sp.]|jgi:tetratricopeptide (TPR) repeat protein|nr:tetratricopeptide repeat protein [Treponema sp.]